MPSEITDELKAEIGRLHRSGKPLAVISEELNCSISTASKYKDYEPESEPGPRKFSESGDTAESEFASRVRITTLADAIKYGAVDTKIWYVDRYECTAWEMGYVRKSGEADSLPLWRVKLYLKRHRPKYLDEATDDIFEKFKAISPDPVDDPDRLGRPVMMCLDLMDIHFGKLAWKPEAGEDYDLKIAESRFRNAAMRLIEHCSPYSLDRVVIPLGNDLCHVDTPAGTTTAGTQMDVDGRPQKITAAIVSAFRGLIDYLLHKAGTIEIVTIPGNHDYQATFYLGEIMRGYYHKEPRVVIDNKPITRKYVKWEKNLIGFTHGKEVKDPRDLTAIMINECPSGFVDSVSREWHLGHLHQHRSTERHGVICRILRSLSGTDAHHFNFGYVGNRKAAEAFIYDAEDGLIANFIAGGE